MFWSMIWIKITFQLQIILKGQINTKIIYNVILLLLELWRVLPSFFSSDNSKNG